MPGKTRPFTLRLTEEEHERLSLRAKSEGMSRSALGKRLLLEGLEESHAQVLAFEIAELRDEVLRELGALKGAVKSAPSPGQGELQGVGETLEKVDANLWNATLQLLEVAGKMPRNDVAAWAEKHLRK